MAAQFQPRRALGRTGFMATCLGIGDLADRQLPLETCVATARRALDAGLNVIDTAPGYEDGYSEQIVGQAMAQHGRRDEVFVIDKIDHHDQPIMPQVDGSLGRLGLDHVELFVFHGLSSLEGWDRVTAAGGGFDQLAGAVKQGKCRFVGISSHNPQVLLRALESGLCDVVMFPVGPFVDDGYITQVLPRAKELGVGTVCFKTFGAGKLVADTTGYNQPLKNRPRGKMSSGGAEQEVVAGAEARSGAGGGGALAATLPRLSVEACLHYTMTLDPDVALLGLSFPNEQDAAFAAAKRFTPLSETQMAGIRRDAVEARRDKGPCWWNPDPQA